MWKKSLLTNRLWRINENIVHPCGVPREKQRGRLRAALIPTPVSTEASSPGTRMELHDHAYQRYWLTSSLSTPTPWSQGWNKKKVKNVFRSIHPCKTKFGKNLSLHTNQLHLEWVQAKRSDDSHAPFCSSFLAHTTREESQTRPASWEGSSCVRQNLTPFVPHHCPVRQDYLHTQMRKLSL